MAHSSVLLTRPLYFGCVLVLAYPAMRPPLSLLMRCWGFGVKAGAVTAAAGRRLCSLLCSVVGREVSVSREHNAVEQTGTASCNALRPGAAALHSSHFVFHTIILSTASQHCVHQQCVHRELPC